MLDETYLDISKFKKTASLFAAATRVGACITNKSKKERYAILWKKSWTSFSNS